MANFLKIFNREKLNPSQPDIARSSTTDNMVNVAAFYTYYETVGIVNRAVNMLVDAASQIDVIVDQDKLDQRQAITTGARYKSVNRVLNDEPNPFMDKSTFRRLIFIDLVVEGNAFIYFDGVHMYHQPAWLVEIEKSEDTYIDHYKVLEEKYSPDEIIHIKDNSVRSPFRGSSRLKSAQKNMAILYEMKEYQQKFFQNGAIPGLVIKSPNALSEKIKTKMIESWLKAYTPNGGGKRPLILDGGLELDKMSNATFKELDFESSIKNHEAAILQSLGVPPILLEGGNNANIRPNQRLFYIETVIPLVDKALRAYERFFGYKILPDNDIPGLQPELRDQADYYSTLVNNGIITVNEARRGLAYDTIDGEDELRVPQNIVGSATDPSQGGRPQE